MVQFACKHTQGDASMRAGLPPRKLRRTSRVAILLGVFLPTIVSGASTGSPEDKRPASVRFVFELTATETEVLQVVKLVAEDSVIRGTYVYDDQKTLTGAMPAESSAYFGPWQGPGHVFYKVLTGALAPRHFETSNDLGTITVRYEVQAVAESRTRLQIDAVFVEDGRRKAHASDGTVETSEFKEIQDRLQQLQLTEQETAAILKKRQEEDLKKAILLRQRQDEAARVDAAESSVKSVELRVRDLRHQVEVHVRAGGAELKSAPFHNATKLQSLAAGTEVVVLIITPYWYGVETLDRHRGWLRHNQVEPLP
jgi:hypothetical protein